MDVSSETTKPSVSYAEQVAAQQQLAKSGQLEGALQNLLALEKPARLGGDVGGTTELVTAMVQMCYDANNWDVLNETISMLAKRRAQLKQATTAMVQQASKYVDGQQDEKLKLQLIHTLRAVSEGKMYVEVERARLTKTLSAIHESKGEVEEARTVMQDTQVETLGGMDKREKTEFILEQIRLCLAVGDHVRAYIVAKKIQPKVFKDVEIDDLKIRYYDLIMRYQRHEKNWLEIFHAVQATWDSPSIQADEAKAHRCLKLQVVYLVLAPYDKDQYDQMNLLATQTKLEQLPMYKQLLKLFITKEIFHFTELRAGLEAELALFPELANEERTLMLDTMHTRVSEHNIEVVSGYYGRITMARLAELTGLSMEKMEKQLCEMVTKKQVFARIDRPAGIITFAAPKTANEMLNDWSGNIAELLDKLEQSCHLIHKENMVHKIA
jgi:26S proteasome regulatory subunit N5